MEKQDIENCEKMLELFNDMYFKELQGKELITKMMIFKNFALTISKYKNAKLEPVKAKEPIKPIKGKK